MLKRTTTPREIHTRRTSRNHVLLSPPLDGIVSWLRTRPSSRALAEMFVVVAILQMAVLTLTKEIRQVSNSRSLPFVAGGNLRGIMHKSVFAAKPQALTFFPDGHVETIDLQLYSIKNTTIQTVIENVVPSADSEEQNKECVQMYDWQTVFYPTCNTMHEVTKIQQSWLVDSGMVRDIWGFRLYDSTKWALKTLRFDRDYNDFHYEALVKDAIVAERATFSNNVADIYGFCGFSSLYEFATEGTLEDHYKHLDRGDRLRAAVQIAQGLADIHSLGGNRQHSAFVHSDIVERQFVKLHDRFQLNDFNAGHMMKWNNTSNQRTCKATKRKHPDVNRAPEEFNNDPIVSFDEKIDVYSLGNIFYQLLMGERKYRHVPKQEALHLILKGDMPKLPNELMEESKDVVVVALKTAMNMSLVFNPEKRASSQQVAAYLEAQLERFEKGGEV